MLHAIPKTSISKGAWEPMRWEVSWQKEGPEKDNEEVNEEQQWAVCKVAKVFLCEFWIDCSNSINRSSLT